MLAAHEALVRGCESDEYVVCERWAIAELCERMPYSGMLTRLG